MALISVKDVSLSYGGLPLLDHAELHVERGERVCLLGVNGTGKSSLLRLIARESNPDKGEISYAQGIRVTRLPQQVPTHLQGRVFDIVCPDPDDEKQTLEARQIISRLHLDPTADFGTLSGGTRRRVLLAQALLGSPDVVLLDEPTNHLDLESIAWLEAFLLQYCRTFLFVTHDRAFLRRMATRVIELDRGKLNNWHCDYDTFLIRKEEALHVEAREWEELDRRREKEEAWRRQGVKARTVRNQGRVRALEALREQCRQRRKHAGDVQMVIQEAERTGTIVLKADNVNFAYGQPADGAKPDAGKRLIHDFSTRITRGDKVGILGPNGCGKTTLLRLLLESPEEAGGLAPQTGRIVRGTNLKIAYSDQLRAQLDESQSLMQNVAQGQEFVMIGNTRRHVIGYLEDFLFAPDRARQPVRSLSGGERNRLLLARLFAQPSNVLVLDEPTNDLDLDTLELLEDKLAAYAGTVLLVSHDRTFLNNVVTEVLVFEKHPPDDATLWLGPDDGWYVNEYVGGYDDWLKSRIEPPEPPAAEPKAGSVRRNTAAPKRRLNDKERKELANLPGHIEAMEAEQEQWYGRMADPAFYKQPAAEIAHAQERAQALTDELEVAYQRWGQLEALVASNERT
jgi:ATP-binding cassette subfamily F protein uup